MKVTDLVICERCEVGPVAACALVEPGTTLMLIALCEKCLDTMKDDCVGLEIGADDYLPKPFDVHELEARIKAVLRRSSAEIGTSNGNLGSTFVFAGWKLDGRQRQLLSPEGSWLN